METEKGWLVITHGVGPMQKYCIDAMLLARIFHGNSSWGAAQPDVDKESNGLQQRLYVLYCPKSNPRLTLYTPGSRKPQQNDREISGLDLNDPSKIMPKKSESLLIDLKKPKNRPQWLAKNSKLWNYSIHKVRLSRF